MLRAAKRFSIKAISWLMALIFTIGASPISSVFADELYTINVGTWNIRGTTDPTTIDHIAEVLGKEEATLAGLQFVNNDSVVSRIAAVLGLNYSLDTNPENYHAVLFDLPRVGSPE